MRKKSFQLLACMLSVIAGSVLLYGCTGPQPGTFPSSDPQSSVEESRSDRNPSENGEKESTGSPETKEPESKEIPSESEGMTESETGENESSVLGEDDYQTAVNALAKLDHRMDGKEAVALLGEASGKEIRSIEHPTKKFSAYTLIWKISKDYKLNAYFVGQGEEEDALLSNAWIIYDDGKVSWTGVPEPWVFTDDPDHVIPTQNPKEYYNSGDPKELFSVLKEQVEAGTFSSLASPEVCEILGRSYYSVSLSEETAVWEYEEMIVLGIRSELMSREDSVDSDRIAYDSEKHMLYLLLEKEPENSREQLKELIEKIGSIDDLKDTKSVEDVLGPADYSNDSFLDDRHWFWGSYHVEYTPGQLHISIACPHSMEEQRVKISFPNLTKNTSGDENRLEEETSWEMDENEDGGIPQPIYGEMFDQKQVEILKYLSEEQKKTGEHNTVFSPVSLNYALGMAYEGTAGSSYEEFRNYFGREAKRVTDGYYVYMEQARTFTAISDGYSEMLLSNSFWYKKEKDVKEEYLKTLRNRYYAEIGEFSASDPSVKAINEWVDENTHHLISEMVDLNTLSENDHILLNTLYFRGSWLDLFSESATTTETFTNLDGSVSEVSMMHGTGNFYFETDSGVGFDKVYYPAKLRFVAFLPNDEQFDICDFDVNEYMQARSIDRDVLVNMPEFQASASLTMDDALKALGFEHIFEDADFSKMSSDEAGISNILQKVCIDVNEKGTVASAATTVALPGAGLPREQVTVTLDRPFVYMIYDDYAGQILVLGVVDTL